MALFENIPETETVADCGCSVGHTHGEEHDIVPIIQDC